MLTILFDGIAIVLQSVIGLMVLAFYHPYLLGFSKGAGRPNPSRLLSCIISLSAAASSRTKAQR